MKLQVIQIRLEADQIISLELRHPESQQLPSWAPGAHLPLTLPSGRIRQYSLCGPQDDPFHYTVAVLLVGDGQGGSREIHEQLRVGDLIEVGEPRNNFPLQPAGNYLFLAGGIGITPILSMIEALDGQDAGYRLIYGARTRRAMAFTDRLPAGDPTTVALAAQDEDGLPDLKGALADSPPGTLVYCCGPPAMLAAVTELCADFPELTLHLERFSAAAPAPGGEADGDGSEFEVHLARTGVTVTVGGDRSVLDAVLEVAPDTPYSCASGFCGTCETQVIAGAVDHRDELLTEAERAANQTMMICVSRSRAGAKLTLDL